MRCTLTARVNSRRGQADNLPVANCQVFFSFINIPSHGLVVFDEKWSLWASPMLDAYAVNPRPLRSIPGGDTDYEMFPIGVIN